MDFLRLFFSYKRLAIACCFFAVLSLALGLMLCFFLLKRSKGERIKRRQRAQKDLQFTLPDKENTFIRERLNGTLSPEPTNAKGAVLLKDMDLKLDYTRKTITKLKASQLTPADRLEVNRISKTVTFFALKNALSPSETRSLNDCFARLLKLCAKYAV